MIDDFISSLKNTLESVLRKNKKKYYLHCVSHFNDLMGQNLHCNNFTHCGISSVHNSNHIKIAPAVNELWKYILRSICPSHGPIMYHHDQHLGECIESTTYYTYTHQNKKWPQASHLIFLKKKRDKHPFEMSLYEYYIYIHCGETLWQSDAHQPGWESLKSQHYKISQHQHRCQKCQDLLEKRSKRAEF